jgi:hypothetical protein
MSAEIALIVAPERTYAALVARQTQIGVVGALRRPLLVAVVLGTSLSLSATGHVTPALVFSTTLLLGVLVVGQVLIALVTTSGMPVQTIGRARAFDLFFASHAPWSLWLLASARGLPSPSPTLPWLAAIAPIVLTPRIIAAYFREVHGLDRRQAALRTVGHQVLTWAAFLALFGAAVAIWPQMLHLLS